MQTHFTASGEHCPSGTHQDFRLNNIAPANTVNRFPVQFPSSLQGIWCYSDASTLPNMHGNIPIAAGIGSSLSTLELNLP
jgi:hypothetical protein